MPQVGNTQPEDSEQTPQEKLLEAARKDEQSKEGKSENLDEVRKELGVKPLNEDE